MSSTSASPAAAAAPSRLLALARLRCPVSALTGRSADRELAICTAVVELLNENSYESVTMDAVAARAKASKATIYRRWSNKDDLVLDALRLFLLGQQDSVADTGSLRDDVIARIRQQSHDPVLAAANTAALKVLVYAASADAGLATGMRQYIQQAQLASWQLLLHRAFTRGELPRPVDAGLVLEVLQGQFCARTSVDAAAVDDTYVQHIVDDVMMPVIAHAASAPPRPAVADAVR